MRRAVCLLLALLALLTLAGCGGGQAQAAARDGVEGSMELRYAENFAVDFYAGGAALLTIRDGQRFLLLPAGANVPKELEAVPQIPVPAENVYLASSSAADLFLQADALNSVRFVSTKEGDWKIPEVREAMEDEKLLYAGKYSAPDYELLLTEGCALAVENTMILHSPATKERLEALGLPVLIEYSSYEPHPLGRVEWIRLWGLLTGHAAEAEAFFQSQCETFRSVEDLDKSGKTVAFFHLTPNGAVVVRRRADYVTRMIELAGAETAITDLPEDDNALSTSTIQMESFYAQARGADVLIYNSTVAGNVETMEQFLSLNPLLADFKAVREGSVWCTEQSMFQRSSAAAGMIRDIRAAVGGTDEALQYLHRIE